MANTTIGGKLRSGTPADVLAPVAGTVEYVNLHESTLPEAIASSQRHEVAEAYRSIRSIVSPGMIAERLSEVLYLELWIVRRVVVHFARTIFATGLDVLSRGS